MAKQLTEYNYDQMRRCVNTGRRFRQDVELDLEEIMFLDPDAVGELLSERATGYPSMQLIDFKVVDFKGNKENTLVVEVSGDPTEVLSAHEAWQLAD